MNDILFINFYSCFRAILQLGDILLEHFNLFRIITFNDVSLIKIEFCFYWFFLFFIRHVSVSENIKYILHSLWAWGFPFAMALFTFLVDYFESDLPCWFIRPKIGDSNCFFSEIGKCWQTKGQGHQRSWYFFNRNQCIIILFILANLYYDSS